MNLQQSTKFSLTFVLLLLLTVGAFAQSKDITGRITDKESGDPLPNVSIRVLGSGQSTTTDSKGYFRLRQVSSESSISISYVGFDNKTQKVGDKTELDIAITKTNLQLDDVIVIGYGSQKSKTVTGSVVSVNMNKLADQPVPSISEALRGYIPNVNVTGGGQRPGIMANITVRQQFNWGKDGGNPNPLVVIDDVIQVDPSNGLPSMDRFNQLDISEVESITVLRDAQAAIYGTRASQGAIVIKTKRGKMGPPKITYSGKFERTDAVSHGKNMNAYEYGIFTNRFGRAIGNWTADQFFTDAELERMKGINYDWLKEAWKPAGAMQHALNVSGGSERATYFMGASYYKQDANLGVNDFDRYTFRAGSDVTVANGLKFSANIGAYNTDLERSFTKISISDGSYGSGGNEQADYIHLLHMPKFIPWVYNIGGIDRYVSPSMGPNKLGNVSGNTTISSTNYFALLNNGSKTTNKTFGYNANFSLAYEVPFVKGLSVKASYAIQSVSGSGEQVMNPQTLSRNGSANKAGYHLYDDTTKWDAPVINRSQSRVAYTNSTGTTEQMNFFVNYDRSFGDHNINAIFSGERGKNTGEDRQQYYDNPVPGFYNGTSVTGGTPNTSNTITNRRESGTLSYLGRVSYNYATKYLFQFLFRADASTRLAPKNYWGLFPTVSFGWVLSDENFFKDNISFVNFLKVRTSLGKTGNDNIQPWRWKQMYSIATDKGMGFGNNGGLLTNGITADVSPNPDVRWDETIQRNFGLDFSILKNRLSVNIDQYYNSISNMLTDMQKATGTPFSIGGGYAEQNYSSVNAWGTEISLTWKDKIANKIDYSVNMNFGTNNYRTTKYFNQPFDYPGVMETRRAVGNTGNPSIWGFRTWKETSTGDGILRTDDDINNYWQYLTDNAAKSGVAGATPKYGEIVSKSAMKKGMIAYEDVRGALNADGTYAGPNGIVNKDNLEDHVMLKKNSRTYGISTNLNISYKGISVSAQIATSWGGYNTIDYIRNATSSAASIWAHPVYMNDMYDAVDNPYGKYPNMAAADFGGTTSDASFWKVSSFRAYVRSLNIGYAVPKQFAKRARLESARLFLAGNNLWDFYNPYPNKYRNMYDAPNVGYPTLRTWALGVNLGF